MLLRPPKELFANMDPRDVKIWIAKMLEYDQLSELDYIQYKHRELFSKVDKQDPRTWIANMPPNGKTVSNHLGDLVWECALCDSIVPYSI